MTRQWGFLCPGGHGLLLERPDWTRLWCPHQAHTDGGWVSLKEATEGYWIARSTTVNHTQETTSMAIDQSGGPVPKPSKRAKPIEDDDISLDAAAGTNAPVVKAEKAPRAVKASAGRDCGCGCGGMTKGGRYLPGHDARFHAAEKRAAAAKAGTGN